MSVALHPHPLRNLASYFPPCLPSNLEPRHAPAIHFATHCPLADSCRLRVCRRASHIAPASAAPLQRGGNRATPAEDPARSLEEKLGEVQGGDGQTGESQDRASASRRQLEPQLCVSHARRSPEAGAARSGRGSGSTSARWDLTSLQGDPSQAMLDFDGNGIGAIHGDYSGAVRDLGVAYQVTGDRRYANHARAILLAYAERYLSYPLHTNQGRLVKSGGARVASQSLTEASWLIPMAQGADLIWDTLDSSQRDTLAQKLFQPAIEETILNRSKTPVIHNIQCHRNSAVGLVGLLLGDQRLIDHAIDGISGYRANMAQGVQADGVWCEGAWGYHFFTIGGTWPLTEAARNCGINLYGAGVSEAVRWPVEPGDSRLPPSRVQRQRRGRREPRGRFL